MEYKWKNSLLDMLFDDKIGALHIDERRNCNCCIDEDKIESFISSTVIPEVESNIQERLNAMYKQGRFDEKVDMAEMVEVYFKGLVYIPNPQATKESLLSLLNKGV